MPDNTRMPRTRVLVQVKPCIGAWIIVRVTGRQEPVLSCRKADQKYPAADLHSPLRLDCGSDRDRFVCLKMRPVSADFPSPDGRCPCGHYLSAPDAVPQRHYRQIWPGCGPVDHGCGWGTCLPVAPERQDPECPDHRHRRWMMHFRSGLMLSDHQMYVCRGIWSDVSNALATMHHPVVRWMLVCRRHPRRCPKLP